MDKKTQISGELFTDYELLKIINRYLLELDFNSYRKLCIYLVDCGKMYKEEGREAIEYVYDSVFILSRLLLPESRIESLYKSQLLIVLGSKEATKEAYSLYNIINKGT